MNANGKLLLVLAAAIFAQGIVAGAGTIPGVESADAAKSNEEGLQEGSETEVLAYLYDKSINGGYVAGGAGMRNRGWGTILIKDIPKGSAVDRAYLYWSVIGLESPGKTPPSYAQGKINGVSINGTLLGFSPSQGKGQIYGYRANVTGLVTGNDQYHLQDFASGYRWGDIEPQEKKYPLMQGASLVVVYTNGRYPLTTIQIKDGIQNIINNSTIFSGFPAYDLPLAKTTFIVSGGQNGNESVKFNGIEMPSYFLDGKDRQDGINYTYGNLQDTNTAYVNVTSLATQAKATIVKGKDSLGWIAQVFSISDGDLDTDGDALRDAWEVYGYDYDRNGIMDVNLPALGADPFHKDIFVEVDWMAKGKGEKRSHYPLPGVMARAIQTFANAPYAKNPDGKAGITLHPELSNKVVHDKDLNPVISEFEAIKTANFPKAREYTHHYSIFAHGYNAEGSSGLAWGSNFMVSLGTWGSGDTANAEVGTFVHELGHNLGLSHGGIDGINYKPNYLSIMNYNFQIDGVYRDGKGGNYDYQRVAPYTLNEKALNESNGILYASGYGTKWYDQDGKLRTTKTIKPIDWYYNGVINKRVAVDLNSDGSKDKLTAWRDWQHIIYNGGTIGGLETGEQPHLLRNIEEQPKELTYEEYMNGPQK
ncbi:MAG: DUF3344 domain-containing protein [Candidatus Methanoperedens sp.]|nr:DUF3344 domain-containing protein [Candidatus Methanoperedens sp.]